MPGLAGQSLTGRWQGYVSMEGSTQRFLYELQLEEAGGTINGLSRSMTADRSIQVDFELLGKRLGTEVVLQELRQITAPPREWCLKHQELQLVQRNDSLLLVGSWSGGACRPGKVYLYRPSALRQDTEQLLPFTMEGKWTGHLDQSDRAYGFFYAITLQSDGRGSSFIVSEGNGGSASLQLTWSFDALRQEVRLQETGVLECTDPNWKWCLKEVILRKQRTAMGYQLQGNWEGHLEGDTSSRGICAPGQMTLHKPVLSRKTIEEVAQLRDTFALDLPRKVNVLQVIEVSGPQLRLGVWDNGVYDGDIITLYLNGKQLMQRYKVKKRKAFIDVELSSQRNFLVLHADDLGEVSPNTVAISIFDGRREQVVVMSADLSESGAVLIKQIDRD